MTKRHFEEMARYCRFIADNNERHLVANAFIAIAKQFNSNFDESRFRAACEPKPKPEKVK